MLLLMLERGMPIDMVLTADTGMEFPEMYAHLAKLDEHLYHERGIHLTTLRHPKGFEYLMFEEKKQKPSSIENRGKLGVSLYGNGWPGVKVRWCTGQLKTHLINKEVNRLKGAYQALHYVGIAADEPKRIKNEQYPLVDWDITEAEALKICHDRGYDWGGLYEIYHRCSCWCCPLQRIDELRKLRHHHPELWQKLREMDQRAIEQFGHNPLGQFKKAWTVERLEQRFAAEDAQISVFLCAEKENEMEKKQIVHEDESVESMLRGTPPSNILVSFDGKPARSLAELQKERKGRKKERGEERGRTIRSGNQKMMNTAAGSNGLPFNFPLATVRRGNGLSSSLNKVRISRALYCVTKLNSLGTESRRLQPPAEPVTMKSYSPFVWAA